MPKKALVLTNGLCNLSVLVGIPEMTCQFNSINLLSKHIFYNLSYSILSRECYTDFVFFKLNLG